MYSIKPGFYEFHFWPLVLENAQVNECISYDYCTRILTASIVSLDTKMQNLDSILR